MTNFRSTCSVEDADEFVRTITSMASRARPKGDLFSVADFLAANLPRGTTKKMKALLDIRSGKISAYLKGAASILNLYTQEDLLADARAGARKMRGKMCLNQALAYFGLNYYEAKAVFLHLADGAQLQVNNRWVIETSKMRKFLKGRILLRVAAYEMGIKTIALRNIVKKDLPSTILTLTTGRVGGRRCEREVEWLSRSCLCQIGGMVSSANS